ncbi:RNA polymerase sigma factor [Tepidibacter formicigenes]|jgi:RNA polymerase sigma factor (sigma-70 family)|uniref:RNA polymerase sigma factor, sigma-70 family n=1 Tax=Tepidibacter formicigenes DSM 15518 TaxID=1123349 RepID=A0A1M6TXF5_9FIRM|nr:RNA polymerase sigma factor [Tepidibacter formicigenes]SHK61564.1 RNA polymerase sigma factor, sigma-70 family [Tepidibacter formicigenes DSM 15518]
MKKSFFEIIEKAKDGDKEAFIEIINKFEPTLKKFSRELNYELAETDLIIALIEIVKGIKSSNFKTKNDGVVVNYIYNSMKNRKVDLFRKYVKGVKEEMEINLDVIENEANYQIEDGVFVKDLLNMLTDIQKIVIVEKFIKGYSDAEIATKLHISRQAVNKAKNKAIKRLKEYLKTELCIAI